MGAMSVKISTDTNKLVDAVLGVESKYYVNSWDVEYDYNGNVSTTSPNEEELWMCPMCHATNDNSGEMDKIDHMYWCPYKIAKRIKQGEKTRTING